MIGKTGLQKVKLEVSELYMRKIAKVTLDEFNKNFYMDNVHLDVELSSIYNQFISDLQKVFDIATPEKKVKLLKRRRTSWYNSDLKDKWKIVRNCERCWMKYGGNSHWQAYKSERNQYNNMLTYKRKNKVMKEILDGGKDTKNYINS